MIRITAILIVGLLSFGLLLGQNPPNSTPKLEVAANGRYLTSGGKPFFWLGDTGWLTLRKLNPEETEKYLEDRRVKGFNVIQIMVLHGLNVTNFYGDSALIGKNVATPKLAPNGSGDHLGYWENLDFVADLAAKKGIYLALVPVWGTNVVSGKVSLKEAVAYAEFLAKRYRDRSNIIWMNGGDIHGNDSIRIWNAIGTTLKKYDPNHLVTFHPFGRTQSSKWFHEASWLDLNMFQSGHRDYRQDTSKVDLQYGEDNWRYLESDYAKKPVKPTLDGEPSYEGIPHGLHDTLQPRWTDDDLRRYAYWSVFAGACGFTYGNNAVMQMHKSGEKTGAYGATECWEDAVNAPGAGQMIHLKDLMQKYHFEELRPDQTLLWNQGDRYNHLACLKGNNCWLVYTYNGRTIQIDGSKLSGSKFRYSWYSPRDGKSEKGGEIAKSGKFEFDPPGEQKEGNDWVLIMEEIK